MKNAKKIYGVGQLVLVLGSILYLVELLYYESWAFTLSICGVYAVALVLLLIGWVGTREERREKKAREQAEKAAKKQAKDSQENSSAA